jgi:hypothetical protein
MAAGQAATPGTRVRAIILDNYFNSTSTDPTEAPQPKNGLALPTSNWGVGRKAWRREWRVQNPASSGSNVDWYPGLRKLVIGGSKQLTPAYYAAQGQVLEINGWDVQGPTANALTTPVTHLYVQVAAYYMNGNSQVFVEPSTIFANYCWGPYSSSATLVAMPQRSSGQNYVQLSQDAASPIPTLALGGAGHLHKTGPGTTQEMGVGPLIGLVFQDTLSSSQPVIKLQIAVYMSLTPPSGGPPVQCFEDPELDVDMGSNK